MKLTFDEVVFVKTAVEAVSIKAADAPLVAKVIEKLDKESDRLYKLRTKTQPSNGTLEAAK